MHITPYKIDVSSYEDDFSTAKDDVTIIIKMFTRV